jgi:hypothetical protein
MAEIIADGVDCDADVASDAKAVVMSCMIFCKRLGWGGGDVSI